MRQFHLTKFFKNFNFSRLPWYHLNWDKVAIILIEIFQTSMTEKMMILFCFCSFFRRESNPPRVTISKGVILVTRMAMEPNQKTADFQPADVLLINECFRKGWFVLKQKINELCKIKRCYIIMRVKVIYYILFPDHDMHV